MTGGEVVILLVLALVILGPEKLPDALRKFGQAYGEFRKMTTGFQAEMREALDEPMRELRETAGLIKSTIDEPVQSIRETATQATEMAKGNDPFAKAAGFSAGALPAGAVAAEGEVATDASGAPEAADTAHLAPAESADPTPAAVAETAVIAPDPAVQTPAVVDVPAHDDAAGETPAAESSGPVAPSPAAGWSSPGGLLPPPTGAVSALPAPAEPREPLPPPPPGAVPA